MKPTIPFEAVCSFCKSIGLPTCKAENLILSRDLILLAMMPLDVILNEIETRL